MKASYSSGVRLSRPAEACSLVDSGVSSPATAALPARSGLARIRAIRRSSGASYMAPAKASCKTKVSSRVSPHDLADGDGVVRGLDHRYEHDEHHGEDRRELEGRQPEEEGCRDAQGACLAYPPEVRNPRDGRDDGSD